MSTTRLTFLYPQFLRAVARPSKTRFARSSLPPCGRCTGRCQSTTSRHGKAVEPVKTGKQSEADGRSISESAATRKKQESSQPTEVRAEEGKTKSVLKIESQDVTSKTPQETLQATSVEPSKPSDPKIWGSENQTSPPEEASAQPAKQTKSPGSSQGPLDAIIQMAPPAVKTGRQHPSMSPPPYVHHFDSYSLVKQLLAGGYTLDQATTFMKGIRMLLAQNLDVAQESLVSKSDVENETYLFRAACSELSTEIKNNRRLQDEEMRQQRTHLQYEVDILTQSLNQELLTLTDNVRGVFNDRKMVVSQEQKTVESAVQQINYKISIQLSSDCKSDIEAVRWVLIRRSTVGIIFLAMFTLATLRYASYVSQEKQKEAERLQKEEEDQRRDGGKRDHATAADAAVLLIEGG